MDGIAMEGPLPPLTKIDDDVDGVEVEVASEAPDEPPPTRPRRSSDKAYAVGPRR